MSGVRQLPLIIRLSVSFGVLLLIFKLYTNFYTPSSSATLAIAPCTPGLLVMEEERHWPEGIGAIAMMHKQTIKLAEVLEGTATSHDYNSDHGYAVSDILPGMVKVACEHTPSICRVSRFLSQEEYDDMTKRNKMDVVPRLRNSVQAWGCTILLIDLWQDHFHGQIDLLGSIVKEGLYPSSVFGGTVTINAHVRWGDTALGTEMYLYGRDKTCNLTSAALAAQQAIASGRQVRVNIFTEYGPDGSLPPMDELDGLSVKVHADTSQQAIMQELGECDILIAGGSQLSVLVAYTSPAKLVVLPNPQVVYVEDARLFGTKYLTSSMFEEGLKGWFSR